MAVKLTGNTPVAPVEANPTVENVATATPAVEQKAGKPKVTCGVFMVATPDGSYKYIGTSSRIEVCWKDYSKWLADKKHSNKELQDAYDKVKGNLVMTVLEECPKASLTDAKKKHCKEQGVDMRVPFTKEVIKAADIK